MTRAHTPGTASEWEVAMFDEVVAERDRLKAEVATLKQTVESLQRFKQSVDEALNSGDGSYRP